LTRVASLTEEAQQLADVVEVTYGQYFETNIYADLYDYNQPLEDVLTVELASASDLRCRLIESEITIADSLAKFMALRALPPGDQGFYFVDSLGWAWLHKTFGLIDSIDEYTDFAEVFTGHVLDDNPLGTDYDAVVTSWKSLSENNVWVPVEYPDYTP
jgi:hypothetical protein